MPIQALFAAFALTSAAAAATLVALDFAYGYVAHRAMHVSPALWKFHRVHHSDAFGDVTTSDRAHPVEVAWRHLWLFATAWILGIPAAGIVALRVLSAINGILEHANAGLAAEPRSVGQTTRSLSVGVAAMCHADYRDDDDGVVDRVEHPVVTVPDSIAVLPRELLGAFWPRIRGKSLNLANQLLPVPARNAFELLRRGPLDDDAITCHAASDP